MSLYWYTLLYSIPIYTLYIVNCIKMKTKYIFYHVLWKYTCIYLYPFDRLLLHYYILQVLLGRKNYNHCVMETVETGNSLFAF